MNSKISIVVPIYGVEKYIDRCIKSLLAQTYKNYEIVLVDDESPDNCPRICDMYASRYNNIITVHKKNGGLSDARNKGVEQANGTMITFVDGDDYVSPFYLEKMVSAIQDETTDIAVVSLKNVYEHDEIKIIDNKETKKEELMPDKALEKVLYQEFHDVSACGMLVPIDVVKKFPFPKNKLFEDLYTTYKYYQNVRKVIFIYEPLYYYLQREDSIMKKRDDSYIIDLIDASNKIVEALKNNKELQSAAKNKRFSNYCRLLIQPSELKSKYPNLYKNIVATVNEEKRNILFSSRTRLKNKVAALSLYNGITGLKFVYSLK